MQTFSITISGKVQGVFFRKYTVEAARKAGVTGFVKNTDDGKVYMEVTGSEAAINEFIKWCHTGSPWSKVESVTVIRLPHKKHEGFDIRY